MSPTGQCVGKHEGWGKIIRGVFKHTDAISSDGESNSSVFRAVIHLVSWRGIQRGVLLNSIGSLAEIGFLWQLDIGFGSDPDCHCERIGAIRDGFQGWVAAGITCGS